MTKEETWSAFITEWERRLSESGVVVGYSCCFGAGLLMEELCFGVGTKKLDKMVEGWDSEQNEADDLTDDLVTKNNAKKLQDVIRNKYSNSDLTHSFPLDRLRRLNDDEDPQLCDMKMIKRVPNITAMYWNGSEWVGQKFDNTIGPYPSDIVYQELGTFRPVNFDG